MLDRKANRKKEVNVRINAYQKGFHTGFQSGVQKVRVKYSRECQQEKQSRKTKNRKQSRIFSKRLAEAQQEAYKRGVKLGFKSERIKLTKVAAEKPCRKKPARHTVVAKPTKCKKATASRKTVAVHVPESTAMPARRSAWRPRRRLLRKTDVMALPLKYRKKILPVKSVRSKRVPKSNIAEPSEVVDVLEEITLPEPTPVSSEAWQSNAWHRGIMDCPPVQSSALRSTAQWRPPASSSTSHPAQGTAFSKLVPQEKPQLSGLFNLPTPARGRILKPTGKDSQFTSSKTVDQSTAASSSSSGGHARTTSVRQEPYRVASEQAVSRSQMISQSQRREADDRKAVVQKQSARVEMQRQSRPAQASGASSREHQQPHSRESFGAAEFRAFLRNPSGVTKEPAAFQLRCKQLCQDGCDHTHVHKKTVIIVSGKTRLWKLNQIISDSFDAGEQDFTHEAKKGATVLGSHFTVSRQMEPGQCNRVVVCSGCSASHIGKSRAFVDDQDCNVAQLFRGTSTGRALEREQSEASQEVIFTNPLLSADVAVCLDGIMLDSYDSGNLFDKDRRYSNRQRPLPRIVQSSFLKADEIEAKNSIMQGSRHSSDVLSKFDSSWSAIHASSRRSQRKPLFCSDGRDFDLNDACHVNGDDELDSEVD